MIPKVKFERHGSLLLVKSYFFKLQGEILCLVSQLLWRNCCWNMSILEDGNCSCIQNTSPELCVLQKNARKYNGHFTDTCKGTEMCSCQGESFFQVIAHTEMNSSRIPHEMSPCQIFVEGLTRVVVELFL